MRHDALRLALVASATSSWMVLFAFQLQAKFGSEVFYHGILIVENASTSKYEGHQAQYLEVKFPRFKANLEAGLLKFTSLPGTWTWTREGSFATWLSHVLQMLLLGKATCPIGKYKSQRGRRCICNCSGWQCQIVDDYKP